MPNVKKVRWTKAEDDLLIELAIKAKPMDRLTVDVARAVVNRIHQNDRSHDATRNRIHTLRRQLQRQGTIGRQQAWYDGAVFGFYDIETTSFKANFGHMLSWALYVPARPATVHDNGRVTVDLDGKVYSDCITRKDAINPKVFDRNLCKSLHKAMKHVDVLVGYYSGNFDNKFVRTRFAEHGVQAPLYQEKYTVDAWRMVRSLHSFGRNTLDQATNFFRIDGKNHVNGRIWNAARVGDQEALKYVLDHNIEDVKILAALFNELTGYRPIARTSF